MPVKSGQNPKKKLSAGKYYPLGAQLKNDGVNFALFSKNAKEVFLLLFDDENTPPTDIIKVDNSTKNIWHVFVHGLKAGQLYGYKVKGDYNPPYGLRFNDNKLLIDPYAKAISSKIKNPDNSLLGYNSESNIKDISYSNADNTLEMPKAIVIDDSFDWEGDCLLDLEIEKLIIYEVHVKGFTAHKSSKSEHPGTYLGFIDKIPYLRSLGINAVEFLPIHEYYVEDFLTHKGLTNYWGYNSICFFAPEQSYGTNTAPGCQVNEFKTLVKELHKAGIEVILDVVYNHTAEGNELGPTISFKGIDNAVYYCLTGNHYEPARYYMNYTGCGNSLNLANTNVIQFVLDSLRYWVTEMHVDGFRFDLASVLGREDGSFRHSASFFDAISQDPVLSHVKLIAEPWDLGTYQVGNFPIDWCEWNGRFRDVVRKFGKGDDGQLKELGYRLTGSADLYRDDGRSAYNSINFITCHDGFTLYDLVSYNYKHNEANLENNCDGSNDNNSWNCGVEGETHDANVINLRKKMIKNYFCLLFFSLGTPMLLGGDEFLRTQKGNNNAYCQDNEINWFNWDEPEKNKSMTGFVRKTIAFCKKYAVLQKKKFYFGYDLNGNKISDLSWFDINGNNPNWEDPFAKTLCYQIDGSELDAGNGNYLLFFILNADVNNHTVRLPVHDRYTWHRVIDTSMDDENDFCDEGEEVQLKPQNSYIANNRSIVVLLGVYSMM